MNDADVSKQIQQMVRFIRQEAEEKANEISVSAEEEFNIEKLQLVEAEKKKIRQEYEKKEKQVDVRKKMYGYLNLPNSVYIISIVTGRLNSDWEVNVHGVEYVSEIDSLEVAKIVSFVDFMDFDENEGIELGKELGRTKFKSYLNEYSMQLNASRIKVLQAQDDVVNSMKEAASKELLNVSRDHHAYKKLLKDLIVQSLLRLKEPAVLLRCRKDDLHLVESVLESAGREYADKAKVHSPEIIVDTTVFLPPAPTHHNPHVSSCSGGMVLASRDGKIVCENTLDARLDVVFRKKLPEIRRKLFGQVAA
ncbi:hypothetical protein C1H46_005928 [Malus baccata]|uniref:V-type proton ATPase subunit E n=2 Tax=Mesangiospermae TaxID=1437183 RepID=A0A540NCY3_MALBA|nr:hypothetical protein C1H46_005928 [Malus baccata]